MLSVKTQATRVGPQCSRFARRSAPLRAVAPRRPTVSKRAKESKVPPNTRNDQAQCFAPNLFSAIGQGTGMPTWRSNPEARSLREFRTQLISRREVGTIGCADHLVPACRHGRLERVRGNWWRWWWWWKKLLVESENLHRRGI